MTLRAGLPVLVLLVTTVAAQAQVTHVVKPGQSIQTVLNSVALSGDTVEIQPGTYTEALVTKKPGVTIRAARPGVVITHPTKNVLKVATANMVIDGITFDGQFGAADTVLVLIYSDTGTTTLRNLEVRRSSRDCIDISRGNQVAVLNSYIHHCLNSKNGTSRIDAHGIVSFAVDTLIDGNRITQFSGDAVQMASANWRRLRLYRNVMGLTPLASNEERNGFAVGVVTGENALDTKTAIPAAQKSDVYIEHNETYGFKRGVVTNAELNLENMAAYNLKQAIRAYLKNNLIRDSDIGIRARGAGSKTNPNLAAQAEVYASNTIFRRTDRAVRAEEGIRYLDIFHATFHQTPTTFQLVGEPSWPTGTRVCSGLFLDQSLPAVATRSGSAGNVALPSSGTVVGGGNYHLVAGGLAVDAGVSCGVPADYDGVARDSRPDPGAYELP